MSSLLAALALSLIVGALGMHLLRRPAYTTLRQRLAERTDELKAARESETGLAARLAARDTELARTQTLLEAEQEKLRLVAEMEDRLETEFRAVAADALLSNNQAFLDLAAQSFGSLQEGARGELEKRTAAVAELIKPVTETLDRVGRKIDDVEKARSQAYGSLVSEIDGLKQAQGLLKSETANLVTALRAPTVRGQWGEMQLRRVVEMAGMTEHCDFLDQATFDGDDGKLRPDLVVLMPGGRRIAIDSKVPLIHFLSSMEAADEGARRSDLQNHSRLVREHVKALGSRRYSEYIGETPAFVVMFMSDAVFAAALQNDAELLDYAFEQGVLMATPMTLMGLLKTVAHSWRQEQLAESAREIGEMGRELHRRLAKFAEHFGSIGRALARAVSAYNGAVGSLESRVLVTARKFEGAGIRADSPLPEVGTLSNSPRVLAAPELVNVD